MTKPVNLTPEALILLSVNEAMSILALFIDQAIDDNSAEQAQCALTLCKSMEERAQGTTATELCYFKANAWSVIRLAKHQDESLIWQWDQPELLNEVYWLRSAISSPAFSELEPFRQCQILVNTGNILNHIGRPIEAIEYWQRALKIIPIFAMAQANLGQGYECYAKQLYDPGHATVVMMHAHDLYSNCLNEELLWDSYAFEAIQQQLQYNKELIEQHVDLSGLEELFLNDYSLGKSKSEREYRQWALEQGLFINPLNDIGSFSIAAHDVLHLPSITRKTGEAPYLIGFFNQLKQEFVSARYLLWQGCSQAGEYKKHFSDKDVLLLDTLDYPAYELWIEQVKIAFRMAYSLFDKIAYFINDYWQLNIPEQKVNFQSVWTEFDQKSKIKSLRKPFEERPNICLRGLYWLSKDFIESDKSSETPLSQTMEPDAELLRTLRNHLEHKYCKVHDSIWDYCKEPGDSMFSDKLAHHVSIPDLISKTVRIMKRARAALIYLSLAVHQEERTKDSGGLCMTMTLPIWE